MNTTHPTHSTALTGDVDDVVGRARAHALEGTSSFFQRIVATDNTLAPALARLTLGLVMLPHGLQKVFGWFGGHGLSATYDMFTTKMGLPGPVVAFTFAAETLGAIMLIVGGFTRIAALSILGVMGGAVAVAHLNNGFFMNWMGNKQGEGFEYHLLAIGLGLVVLLAGGGRVSIDRALTKETASLDPVIDT